MAGVSNQKLLIRHKASSFAPANDPVSERVKRDAKYKTEISPYLIAHPKTGERATFFFFSK